MTTAKISITITLSDRRPISIVEADWPIIAYANWHSGEHACQANEVACVEVREHADGRRVVYASRGRGPGGMALGYRGAAAGYMIPAADDAADDAATVRAIRRVAGAIGHEELGAEAIGDLPAEEI